MKYAAKISKRINYIRVYTVTKKIGRSENFLTKLFVKMLTKRRGGEQPMR